MRKYIITLLLFMGIFTFSLFKSEQSKNRNNEIEKTVSTTTQTFSTTTSAAVTATTVTRTTIKSAATTVTTTITVTETTVSETVIPDTEPAAEQFVETQTVTVDEIAEQPIVDETIMEEPIVEQIQEPAPEDNSTAETAPESNMTYLGNLKITGYFATGNPTASGVTPYVGGVAMSQAYGLPFDTTIYIEGLGYYTLNDTGCSYGVVDVFCGSVNDCFNLTSYANVYVVNQKTRNSNCVRISA